MIKIKLISLIQSLSKKELKELNYFIESPYYNKNQSLVKFFIELKKFYPEFNSKVLTKEYLYAKVFPGARYSDKTFRNMVSDILKIAEKFLVVTSLEKNKLLHKYLLINSLSRKDLVKLAAENIQEADRIFEESLFDGGNSFFIKHLIEMERDFIEIARNKFITLNMKEGEYIICAFLSKYMLFKMKLTNYKQKINTEKESDFISKFDKEINLDQLMKYLETTDIKFKELILAYYYTTKFMTSLGDDSSFSKALELFYRNKASIDLTETTNFYITFTGYCALKISRGEAKYLQILFDLYNKMMEEDLLKGEKDKYLHITMFYNVVNTALMLGKTDWTRSFIEGHAPLLLPDYKDSMYHFAYARYYFTTNEFETALKHLSKVNLENYWIKSTSRIMQLRIYFELGHVESFFSLYDSLNHFIRSNVEITEQRRKIDSAFISILNKLGKVKFGLTGKSSLSEQLQSIRNETDQSLKGRLKEWILAKIEQIDQ